MPPKHEQGTHKKKSIIEKNPKSSLFLVIVCFGISGFLFYKGLQKPYIPSLAGLGLADIKTANWKTYTNSDYAFQFKYPDNYTVQSTPNSVEVWENSELARKQDGAKDAMAGFIIDFKPGTTSEKYAATLKLYKSIDQVPLADKTVQVLAQKSNPDSRIYLVPVTKGVLSIVIPLMKKSPNMILDTIQFTDTK